MAPAESATAATWKTLHVKLPTETVNGDGRLTPSDTWLDAHPDGFLLMRNLHPAAPLGKCMLVKSYNDNKFLVNKRLKRWAPQWKWESPTRWAYRTPFPPEIRFARLDDPRVEVRLSDEPYFPELYAYGIPGGERSFFRPDDCDLFSLYFKRFNGRTLENLMDMYSDTKNGAPVPEPFIWHVIEQLCRAVIFLHTGLTRGDLAKMPSTPKPGWRPVVHRNISESNILLHFPEDDEEQNPLDCCFPRIILEGFDQANLLDDPSHYWCQETPVTRLRKPDKQQARPSLCEDLHMMGEVFRRLVGVHDAVKETLQKDHMGKKTPQQDDTGKKKAGNPEKDLLAFNVNTEVTLYEYLAENLGLEEGQQAAYSNDLIYLLLQWERDELFDNSQLNYMNASVQDEIPKIDFLIEIALPLAAVKVEEYRSQGLTTEADDVSWVVPDPGFDMTPHYINTSNEASAMTRLTTELRYLYGDWIPVRYTYANVVVTSIPEESVDLHTPYHTKVERAQEPPSDPDGGEGPDDSGGGLHDGLVDTDDGGGGPDGSSGDGDDGDHGPKKKKAPAGLAHKQLDPRVANIRKYQFPNRAKEDAVRVWNPLKKVKLEDMETGGDLNKTRKLRNIAQREYKRQMGDKREELKRRVVDDNDGLHLKEAVFSPSASDGRLCMCSNCTRRWNLWILRKVDFYTAELLALHHNAVDAICMPEFQGRQLSQCLEFEPLFFPDEIPLSEPENPFNVDNGVEDWRHNPFGADYREDWEPDRAYPWRKWDYFNPNPNKDVEDQPNANKDVENQKPRPKPKPKDGDTAYKRPAGQDSDGSDDEDDEDDDGKPPRKSPRISEAQKSPKKTPQTSQTDTSTTPAQPSPQQAPQPTRAKPRPKKAPQTTQAQPARRSARIEAKAADKAAAAAREAAAAAKENRKQEAKEKKKAAQKQPSGKARAKAKPPTKIIKLKPSKGKGGGGKGKGKGGKK